MKSKALCMVTSCLIQGSHLLLDKVQKIQSISRPFHNISWHGQTKLSLRNHESSTNGQKSDKLQINTVNRSILH